MSVRTPGGCEIDLVRVARRACLGFVAECPDYATRYGPAGMPWCVHDNQHILNWAILSLHGTVDLEHELAWLARVLEAREFPLAWLVRGVQLLCAAMREEYPDVADVAERVGQGVAAAVFALEYGFVFRSNSGSRNFAPVATGMGPTEPNCSVEGSTLAGTM